MKRPGLTGFVGQAPGVSEVKSVPDAELIATMVGMGCPLISAKAVSYNRQARFHALRFWSDVQDMHVNVECKARVDYVRSEWARMRRDEIIRDIKTRPV